MHSYRSTMEGSLLTCTAYVCKHTHTSRRDAVYEGPELMEHERKQCNFFIHSSFIFCILISFQSPSSHNQPSHSEPLPLCFPSEKAGLTEMSTEKKLTISNTAMQKYPYQGRKIKHNRRNRVPRTRKSTKDTCTASVCSFTRNPR